MNIEGDYSAGLTLLDSIIIGPIYRCIGEGVVEIV